VFLREVRYGGLPLGAQAERFPWTLPLLRNFEPIAFTKPITFLVGENGTGKSTLLESMAVAAGATAIGGADMNSDPTLAAARALAPALTLVRGGRPRAKLFMRAEDVFGYTQRVAREMRELQSTASEFAGTRAQGYIEAQRRALTSRYGEDPDARSHGETFLALLQARLVPAGLYFLDEPETPLSPVRVLALLAILGDAVAAGSQFAIATHSPILMAYPGADIRQIEDGTLSRVAYEDVEHVRVTRDFLNAPKRYLRGLALEADDGDADG
jgi:predicted ATPase